ncbi:hypothetical protein [Methyloradius palustris]|uniref:Uncharacterized protein n=1 Tax=Methyloradius palustris TaxID=2778876 RepID=A0A8D5JWW6_9PROT|nr:hypothetical protein [Methyloradius palustris]BCM25529.1 hypothetical protein ZMTM_17880 [Methyloradius palustris]
MSSNDKKIVGVIFLILFLCIAYDSIAIYQGEIPYPEECHAGKGSIICHFKNLVFEEGGYYGVAMLNVAFSLIFLVLAFLMFFDESYNQKNNVIGKSRADEQEFSILNNEKKPQTFEDILHGEEPTEEFLEDFIERSNAPKISDDELERQALEFKPDAEQK